MATPLGHSLAGYAVSQLSATGNERERIALIVVCVAAAVTPDLDLIPGILQGKPVLYHGSITHSLGFAVLVSLGMAGIFRLKGKPVAGIFRLCFMAYASHLLLDIIGPDGRVPYGIPLLWPLSDEHFISPVPLLLGVRHVGSTSASTFDFVVGILSVYNIAAVGLELLLIVPLIAVGQRYRYSRERRKSRSKRQNLPDQLHERNI